MRNSICTHAHPVALIGSVVHALTLAHTIAFETLPDRVALVKLIRVAEELPSWLGKDAEVNEFWITTWERESGRSFAEEWHAVIEETAEVAKVAGDAVSVGTAEERYATLLDALGLRDPARRGSGQLTAIAAVALSWCDIQPAEALAVAANSLGSDTDTIATMAGALLGVVADVEPPVDVLDKELLIAEAERLAAIAAGDRAGGYRYPDLLSWTAPRTQADALVRLPDDSVYVLGLGPVTKSLGEPLRAAQGGFQWQWVELALGQTLLIKRRAELPPVHSLLSHMSDTETATRRAREDPTLSVLDQSPGADARPLVHSSGSGRTEPSRSARRPQSDERPTQDLDIGRVVAYIAEHRADDVAIGYAVRRVSRDGTPEQIAVFLGALIELMRR
jgi:hypothetical protein